VLNRAKAAQVEVVAKREAVQAITVEVLPQAVAMTAAAAAAAAPLETVTVVVLLSHLPVAAVADNKIEK